MKPLSYLVVFIAACVFSSTLQCPAQDAAPPKAFDGSKFAEEAGKAGIPREMLNLYLYAAKKIEWAASSFSLARIISCRDTILSAVQ